MAKKIGSNTETKVAYVGNERFVKLTEAAIDISSKARKQITPSQLMQYIVDTNCERVVNELAKDFSKYTKWEAEKREVEKNE